MAQSKLSKKTIQQFAEWGKQGGMKTKERGSDYYRKLQKKSVKARKKKPRTGIRILYENRN